jgi:hypothetical protein
MSDLIQRLRDWAESLDCADVPLVNGAADALEAQTTESRRLSAENSRYREALTIIWMDTANTTNEEHRLARIAREALDTASTRRELDDGCGNRWPLCSPDCKLEIVRPGKVQCECDDAD